MLSPGNHSNYLAGQFVNPSPRTDTTSFPAELERIAQEHEIDLIVPGSRSLLYLNPDRAAPPVHQGLRLAVFSTLARLHGTRAFEWLVRKLGLRIPETVLVGLC